MAIEKLELGHKQLKSFIKACRKANQPIFLKGATGIGKSEGALKEASEYAAEKQRKFKQWVNLTNEERHSLINPEEASKVHLFIDVRTALLEPTDLMGMPDFSNQGHVEWKATLLFKVLSTKNISATLFFDEFNLGSRMVQNASYQIILDKAIGETKLAEDVYVLAAGNRTEDKANVIETPMPLNNRFAHVQLKIPTEDEWIEYNMKSPFAEARISGFLKAKPEYIHNFKANQREEAFSTPRSLQKLAQMIHEMDENKELTIMCDLARAMCGSPFAVQFQAFLKLSRKVDIDEILKNPKKVKECTGEVDLKYSVVSSLAFKCKKSLSTHGEPVLKVLEYLDDETGVFTLRMIKEMVGQGRFVNLVTNSKTWKDSLSAKYDGLLGWSDEK